MNEEPKKGREIKGGVRLFNKKAAKEQTRKFTNFGQGVKQALKRGCLF